MAKTMTAFVNVLSSRYAVQVERTQKTDELELRPLLNYVQVIETSRATGYFCKPEKIPPTSQSR